MTEIDIDNTKIGVVGAGSWGTALAKLLAEKGFNMDLWAFEPEVKEQIETKRENIFFLPGKKLPENIVCTNNLEKAVKGKDLVLIVVPSHCMREVAEKMKGFVSSNTVIVTASKGIENKTHLTMFGVLKEILVSIKEKNLCVLSGPSFAKEVAERLPSVVAVASTDKVTAEYVQHIFACSCFRVYTNDDPVGVEIGGAMKNVIAIAAGICDGMNMGLNARAALITRGLTEMNRLGIRLGANPHTLSGLSGVGDLLLTCTGDLSRNYTVGKRIGAGEKIEDITREMRMVAEGVKTTKSVYNLSKKLGINLPICNEVYYVLYENLPVADTRERLMNRALKHELDGIVDH
ncbi:MAG: NAD(P)-dependent glycerol-3-phosphate dehydrogenase [Desulfobacteraceae bacterium]|nr:NAD(P)-dependent glycerol-3-phosphate dehydrogenase [Desulfobacteraceae bacterium]